MTESLDFLDKFILQAHSDSLKTSEYPKEFLDLKMKVSFGQGGKARIPWINFTAQEMSASNGYFPVYLYYRDLNVLILAFGISETNEYGESWASDIVSDKTKICDFLPDPPRYGSSYVFKSYTPKIADGKVFYSTNNVELPSSSLSNDLIEIINIYKRSVDIEVKKEASPLSSGLFYMEKQLEDFIISNWDKTELGVKYDLIYEEGELVSQQYRTDIGPIDILARDKKTKNYVVIELKRNQTSDDTIGQLARYMGWIKKHKNDQNVQGIVVAGQFDKKLSYATTMMPNIEVFIYEVSFSLKEHSTN
jgi:Holliday junction resolvase-like predicted endonuclease